MLSNRRVIEIKELKDKNPEDLAKMYFGNKYNILKEMVVYTLTEIFKDYQKALDFIISLKEPKETPTLKYTPTPTQTPTPILTPTVSPQVKYTPTPTPTPIITPISSRRNEESRGYLLFEGLRYTLTAIGVGVGSTAYYTIKKRFKR